MKDFIVTIVVSILLITAIYCIVNAVKLEGTQFWLSFGACLSIGAAVALLRLEWN